MSNHHTIAIARQRGFTLSEILVTTAIFAIIMLAALAVYDRSNRVFKTSTEAADLQQSTRVGFDKLISDVRMAGFDYNRGGIPTESWQAPQPDEQVEYAGTNVLIFRSNFNYQTASAQGNGLEPTYTPYNVSGDAIFPYVTTSNDEVVTYALRSADPTKNTNSVSFYVDDYQPRAAFPSAISPAPKPANPSHPEALVTLGPTTCGTCGIDITNANPPYTLYRITLSDVLGGRMGTPVAENIRSLKFRYYTDGNGQTPLTNPDGSPITSGRNADGSTFTAAPVATCTTTVFTDCTGAIGGAGQYDPNNVGTTTNFNDRNQRAIIQSVRVDLVGMNANPDINGYSNPTETIPSLQNYREYALSSLIVPRNLGKTGFPEPVYSPPGPPTITGMCTGYCGAPVIYWAAPTSGGLVESYIISWDTNPLGTFAPPHQAQITDPTVTHAQLPDTGTEDVSQTWYYRIAGVNANGTGVYSDLYSAVPKNNTKPQAPNTLAATGSGTAQANQITLSWTSPSTNDSSLNTLSCSGTGGSTDGSTIPSGEIIGYKIYRGTTANFALANSVVALDYSSASQPSGSVPGSAITWVDKNPNDYTAAPANCTQYYYRIEAANRCRSTGTYNVSGNAGDAISSVYPAWGSNAIAGNATSTGTPSAPITLVINGSSGCPDPLNPSSSYCRIILNWPRVTTDTSGNAIGVDTYRITRSVKHQNDLPSPLYSLDTSFGGGTGYVDVPGYSQMGGGTLSYTDTTALVTEPSPPFVGVQFSYEYTVQAEAVCSPAILGAKSPTADYPASCTGGAPAIGNTGGSGGAGDTPGIAWVLNAGDSIYVTPPGGVTYSTVTFTVSSYPSGGYTNVVAGTYSSGTWSMTWGDLTSLAYYMVVIRVTDTTGCSSTYIKYVQQQSIAPCAFPNVTPPAVSTGSGPTKNTEIYTFTVPNNGTDKQYFSTTTGLFAGAINFSSQAIVTWNDPRTPPSGKTYNATSTALVYNTNTDNFTGSTTTTSCCPLISSANQVTTRTVPSAFGPISAPGCAPAATCSSWTFQVQFQHANSEKNFGDSGVNPTGISAIKKMCISYIIPSEPITIKKCNLVGQATPTANPNACD